MSVLFESGQLGNLTIKNRFVHSATHEGPVDHEKRYRKLAKGGVGLIIPGNLAVHSDGRLSDHQLGIDHDGTIPVLEKIARAVQSEGSRIVFQLNHAGRLTTKKVTGKSPLSASAHGRDPVNFVKPKEMTEEQIWEVINAFKEAAIRAFRAGADGVQLHAAHGYLINQFLSPFFNRRTDSWGGSDENRFRFLREIVLMIQSIMPSDRVLLVKLNSDDYIPKKGLTVPTAVRYAKWLSELNIDGLEMSCGNAFYSTFNLCRGEVPVKEMVRNLPWWMKLPGKLMLSSMSGKFDLVEGYNLSTLEKVRAVTGDLPLFSVGGMRNVTQMESIIDQGAADFISMSRPFVMQPSLVKQIESGKVTRVSCKSCNRCLAAVSMDFPLRCYYKGIPPKASVA